jgi:PadR family transcriptional regulator PadR
LCGVERDRRAQWLRGVLDLCVLGALTRGESYGYEIAQRLDAGGLGPVAGGTLYPTLLRLERLGLVATEWRAGAGGPARKYYRLSDAGRGALQSAATDWVVFVDRVNVLMEVATP